MDLITINIDDYKPHPDNYNRHPDSQIGELGRSLDLFKQFKNVVIWRGYYLAGHGLVEAARRKGITQLDAVDMSYLSEAEAKMLMVADNRLPGLALPDDKALADILKSLDAPLEVPGVDLDFLKSLGLADGNAPKDVEPQVDKAAELQVKWGTATGQVWTLGEHRLAVGDCTDKAVVEAVMRGERADLGLTSPPYAVGKEYEINTSFEDHLILLRNVADRALETIKPGGFFFVNFGEIAAQSHTKPLTGSDRQCLYPISKDYWQIFHIERKMDLYAQRIWYKPFNRLQQPFWTYHTSIPHHQEWEHIWTWRLPGGGKDECYDWDISSRAVWDTRNEATDDKPLTRHVAAFPVCLPERAIRAHSANKAIVWEPFSGSGTTIIVCENLKRKCRAIEIDPGYVGVTLQRWLDLTGKDPRLNNFNT